MVTIGPESQKKLQCAEQSKTIGDFLEWLQSEGYTIARYRTDDGHYYPVPSTINQWLADYFNIDLDKLEQERRAILQQLADAQGS